MSVDPGDWSLVTLKQVQDPRPRSMSAGCVDCPLLAANNEVVDVILREGQTRYSHGFALFVLELQRLLGLGQHVQGPGAHLPCGCVEEGC